MPFWAVVILISAIGIGLAFHARTVSERISEDSEMMRHVHPRPLSRAGKDDQKDLEKKRVFVPGNFSMDTLKLHGCVADGILSGYGGKIGKAVSLIDRSNCRYLHRALETWGGPPDFNKASDVISQFDKPGLVFGMFLAEAIRDTGEYKDPATGKEFSFRKMCQAGTVEKWGWHTCLADFNSKEYRKYIESITQRAMDIGIQSFTFGQIYLQDNRLYETSKVPKVVQDMRDYARSKNLQIAIGAQTNAITDPKYLKMFDYIEGGVGIDSQGNIENGACWSQKSGCWALLWNKRFSANANNVLLDLDWSGIENDDMSTFARMDKTGRDATLKKLYDYFTSRNMGFLMPILTPLYPDNGGCYGPKKEFYSPDNHYKCQDESAINTIMDG